MQSAPVATVCICSTVPSLTICERKWVEKEGPPWICLAAGPGRKHTEPLKSRFIPDLSLDGTTEKLI